jgi:acetyl esterase/lipase
MNRREFQTGALGAAAATTLPAAALAQTGGKAMAAGDGGLAVPARVIPVPKSISPEAQAFLSNAAKRIAATGGAASPGDQGPAADAALRMLRPRAAGFKGSFETIELPYGVGLYRAVPEGRSGKAVYFDIHGGGFTAGGGEMCQVLTKLRAMELGVEVLAVDYRLAPQHVFPAALDDCMSAWAAALSRTPAKDIVVAGSSAGGNLAAAMLLRGRAEGLAMPAALVLLTPGVDLTGAGDTRETNRYLDVNLYGGGSNGPSAYAGTADPRQPYLSPVYGNFTGGWWPPTLLASGTRDLLLSDTVRMHRTLRRAAVRAELHVFEAGPHGNFMGTAPEDRELLGEVRRFCREAWGLA